MKIRLAKPEDIPTILDLGQIMMEESRFQRYGLNHAKTAKMLEVMIGQPAHDAAFLAETSGIRFGLADVSTKIRAAFENGGAANLGDAKGYDTLTGEDGTDTLLGETANDYHYDLEREAA